jgi:hypothetical protein
MATQLQRRRRSTGEWFDHRDVDDAGRHRGGPAVSMLVLAVALMAAPIAAVSVFTSMLNWTPPISSG